MHCRQSTGQGSLEYLLLIGGAVVVGSIVIVLLLGASNSGQSQVSQETASVQNKYDELGAGGNLVTNGGFENGLNGWSMFAGWQNYATAVNVISSNCESGSNCLGIGSAGGQTGLYQAIPTSPGTKYVLKGYCKGTGCRIGVQMQPNADCSGTWVGEEYDVWLDGSSAAWAIPQVNSHSGSYDFLSKYPNPWVFQVSSSNAKCMYLYVTNDNWTGVSYSSSSTNYDVISLKTTG